MEKEAELKNKDELLNRKALEIEGLKKKWSDEIQGEEKIKAMALQLAEKQTELELREKQLAEQKARDDDLRQIRDRLEAEENKLFREELPEPEPVKSENEEEFPEPVGEIQVSSEDQILERVISDEDKPPEPERVPEFKPMAQEIPAQPKPVPAAPKILKMDPETPVHKPRKSKATFQDFREFMVKRKNVKASDASNELDVDKETLKKWAGKLSRDGLLEIRSKFLGGAVFSLTSDAIKKIKEKEELEKAEWIRRELRKLREDAKAGRV